MDGIIIIDKPKGYTSHDIVNIVRKAMNTKKVGHTGTLDPNATGVLPILIGKATKISKYLIEHDKTYIATIKLGTKTDTGDADGKVIAKKEVTKIGQEEIKKTLESFIGTRMQMPPMYSAIKVKGKKLYEYIRQGEKIDVSPREINIYGIKLLQYQFDEIMFEVHCSKGTYIRVLCEEIAEKLNQFGYMLELQRIKVNEFDISQAIKLEELKNMNINIQDKMMLIEQVFHNQDSIIIEELDKFINGMQLHYELEDGVYRIYNNQRFIGLGILKNGLLKRDVII